MIAPAGTPADPRAAALERLSRKARRPRADATGFDVTKPSFARRNLRTRPGIGATADRHLDERTRGEIMELARRHDRNSSIMHGLLDRAAENIVGRRITLQANTGDLERNELYEEYIRRRSEARYFADDGRTNLTAACERVLRALWTDGDLLSVHRSDGRLAAFEADQLSTPPDLRDQNLVGGCRLDARGRITTYYVRHRPTGERRYDTPPYRPIQARNAILTAHRTRANQIRGIAGLSSVLGMFDYLDQCLENELVAAAVNSLVAHQIVDILDDAGDPIIGLPDSADANDPKLDAVNTAMLKLKAISRGGGLNLAGTGTRVEAFDPGRPHENFAPFVLLACRLIGVGVGYPIELALLDYSQSTFSSSHMGWDQTKRSFQRWQRLLGDGFVSPWYRRQIARGIASGELPAGPRAMDHDIAWPVWLPPKPKEMAQVYELLLKNRLASRRSIQLERGADPEKLDAEIQADTLSPWHPDRQPPADGAALDDDEGTFAGDDPAAAAATPAASTGGLHA